MKTNYDARLQLLIKELEKEFQARTQDQAHTQEKKPSLLLHACCGPCSSYVIEYISNFFDITILYYNPNIYPESEYNRRLSEIENFLPRFKPAVENKIKFLNLEYNPQKFYDAIKIKENPELAHESEKGERCRRCYEFRLKKAYLYALENGFDYFCTTLSISPFKDAQKINVIGESLCKENASGPQWLYSDFKKNSGFLRSLELSKEYGLYRQQYCGCVYSAASREQSDSNEKQNCSN